MHHMQAAVWGNDAEALQRLAQAMANAASAMDNLRARLSSQLQHCPWHGSDAESFVQDWANRLAPSLAKAVQSLRDTEHVLRRNAQEQVAASAASGATAALGAAVTAVGGAGSVAAAHAAGTQSTYRRDIPASTQQLDEAAKRAAIVANSTVARDLPLAAAKVRNWAAELKVGQHSSVEVEAFNRFTYLVMMAKAQQIHCGVRRAPGTGRIRLL